MIVCGNHVRQSPRHSTLVERRLGKTLSIKHRVWDLVMFTIDMQNEKRSQEMIDFNQL